MAVYVSAESFRCHTETDEVGADEPYFLVGAVDLANTVPVAGFAAPIPASNVVRYGAFGDVDAQETHGVPFAPFWGLNGDERGLNPDSVIFVVGLMENDDGNPEALRGIAAAQLSATLFATLGAPRPTVVGRVLQALGSSMQVPTGGPSTDEAVGLPQELRFTQADVALAETGNAARQSLRFQGDGGDYTLTFVARNRGQGAWRFCTKCRSLFFDGFPTKGICPAGGGHSAAASTYFMPHDHPGPLGGQERWRFCNRCFAMFFAGDPANQGRCPGGGSHDAQGFEFFLPHDHAGPGQREWRFCDKCRVMFFNGEANKGACTTGGGHNAQGFVFILDHEAA
jgi:hypothetical protein